MLYKASIDQYGSGWVEMGSLKEDELAWAVKVIDNVLSSKGYIAEGIADNGSIVFSVQEEAGKSLWVIDKSSGDQVKLVEGSIGHVSAAPSSPWILYSLDVSRGRESSSLIALNIHAR